MLKIIASVLAAAVVTANAATTENFTSVMLNDDNREVIDENKQKDPFGDPEAEIPPVGSKFQFSQNMQLRERNASGQIEVTPDDVCYFISGPGARGECRIYVEGADPSKIVYTRFWRDTEFTVLQKDAMFIGDVYPDARIDAFDMALARRYFVSDEDIDGETFVRLDYNQDGKLQVSDLVSLQRFLLGV